VFFISGRYLVTGAAGSITPSAASIVARVPTNDFVTEKALCGFKGSSTPQ
jgi:hypothetical protein